MEAQVAAAIKEILDDFKKKYREFQQSEPLWDQIQAFMHAVDWKERWIQVLVAAHVVLLILVILTRKNVTAQTCLLGFIVGVTFMGERLNALARQHWRAFSQQNYFDPSGLFWGIMVSGPLLISAFIILINYLRSCVAYLIEAKRAQLKYQARQRRRQEQQGAGGQAGPSEGKKDK